VSLVHHACIRTANLSGRNCLCSVERGDLAVPKTATELGKRSLYVAAPVIWNSLPEHLQSSSISTGQLRGGLKPYLFQQAYNTTSENLEFLQCIELN